MLIFSIPVAETIKNLVEFLNEIYNPTVEFQWIIYFKVFWSLLQDWIKYICTFKWLFNFFNYPIYVSSFYENIFHGYVGRLFNYEPDPELNFVFNFVSFENTTKNLFSLFSGFFGSCFLYLPVSCAQLIWLRRVIIEGEKSGRAALIGLICGNLSLFAFCLFGLREIIHIWFSFELLNYCLGIVLILITVYEMSTYPMRTILQLRTRQFWKVTTLNFLLVWTNQPSVYHFIKNLSFYGVTLLDFSTNTSIVFYLSGIVIGSIFWTYLIKKIVLSLNFFIRFVMKFTPYNYTYVSWIKGFNRFCLTGCIAFIATNLPLYGLDYLVTNSLGFIPQDLVWEKILLFSPLKSSMPDVNNRGRLGEKSSYHSIDTDLSVLNEGHYGGAAPIEFHFETLNYRKEYAWRSRYDRTSSHIFRKGGGLLNRYLNEKLGPLEEARKVQRKQDKKSKKMQRVRKVRKLKKQRRFKVKEEPNLYILEENENENEKLSFLKKNQLLIERFIQGYENEATKNTQDLPDLPSEKLYYFSSFSEMAKYGFDVFSLFENPDSDPVDEEVANDIKQKYYDNFVYKFFLNLDIRNFLKRQPYQLSSKDEINLFKIRLALGEYYNTLRYSNRFPSFKLFSGPKSYCNRIYNQQFKGTLKIVERLFSVNLEKNENIPMLNVEKNKKKELDSFFKDRAPLKFDQPLYLKNKDFINPLLHEQLMKYYGIMLEKLAFRPYIMQEERPFPFFVGWDNEKRMFVLTNRFLTDGQILTDILLPKDDLKKFFEDNIQEFFVQPKQLDKTNKTNETDVTDVTDEITNFTFTTWPISDKEKFYENTFLKRLYRNQRDLNFLNLKGGEDLFKYISPTDEEVIMYKTLPSTLDRVDLKNTNKINSFSAPSQGGFFWPGNLPLKLKIKEKFITPILKKLGL